MMPFKPNRPDLPPEEPTVSLIITAHNEEKCILEKLKNSLALDYPKNKLEVILALDGCTDRTHEFAIPFKELGLILLPVSEHRGKSHAQNLAVRKSTGAVLVFSDTNAMLLPDAIRHLVGHFSDPGIGSVCGDLRYWSRDNDSLNSLGERLYKKFDNWVKDAESRMGVLLSAEGSLFALRREFYSEIGTEQADDILPPLSVVEQKKLNIYEKRAVSLENYDLSDAQQLARRTRIITRLIHSYWLMRRMFNPFYAGWNAIALWVNKGLKLLSPFFLIALFISSAAGAVLGATALPLSRILAAGQLGFYLLAGLHPLLRPLPKPLFLAQLVYLPYAFVLFETGILLGWIHVILGKKVVLWPPSR